MNVNYYHSHRCYHPTLLGGLREIKNKTVPYGRGRDVWGLPLSKLGLNIQGIGHFSKKPNTSSRLEIQEQIRTANGFGVRQIQDWVLFPLYKLSVTLGKPLNSSKLRFLICQKNRRYSANISKLLRILKLQGRMYKIPLQPKTSEGGTHLVWQDLFQGLGSLLMGVIRKLQTTHGTNVKTKWNS